MPRLNIPFDDVIAAIEQLYGIRLIAPPQTLPQGVHSAAWLVATEQGRWVAKVSDPASDPLEKLYQQAQLYDYLCNNGIQAPRILPLRNGDPIGTMTHNQVTYPLQLMHYESLRKTTLQTITLDELQEIARMMAQLHQVLALYPERNVFIENSIKSANEWGKWEEGLNEVLQRVRVLTPFSRDEEQWFYNVDQRMLEYINERYPDTRTLSLTILHGDLNLEHVQFLPDGTPYIFDFGDASWGPIAHELAVFLQNCYCDSDMAPRQLRQLQTHLIDEYTSVVPLSQEDMAAIPLFLINRIHAQACYIMELAADTRRVDVALIRRTYALAEQLMTSMT